MAFFYPHKQTVVIACACVIAVGAAAYYAYGSTWKAQSAQNIDVVADASTPTDASPLPDTDWEKEFLSSGSWKPASSGTKASEAVASDEPLTLTEQFGRSF